MTKESFEDLAGELIIIGRVDGFFPKSMLDPYWGSVPEKDHPVDSNLFEGHPPRNKRAYKIGQLLNKKGGFELMIHAHHLVHHELGAYPARKLEQVWAGIGQWLG